MEHAIKTRITLEVVERVKGCNGCFFGQGNDCIVFEAIQCEAAFRTDHKNVIYKEIKEA